MNPRFPALDPKSMSQTRQALHAYAKVLGAWLKACRPRRKHWWHASLRPTVHGAATGLIHARHSISLELSFRDSRLAGRSSNGDGFSEPLKGQSAAEVAERVHAFMRAAGVDDANMSDPAQLPGEVFPGYSQEQARLIGQTVNSVHAALDRFRSGIREETSPIQLWPHYFDVAMLWLPGDKVASKDPGDEEVSDKHMQFGFMFADEFIGEPYFYVTAYPTPMAFSSMPLPPGARWETGGFQGVVLPYRASLERTNTLEPAVELWAQVFEIGRPGLLAIQ